MQKSERMLRSLAIAGAVMLLIAPIGARVRSSDVSSQQSSSQHAEEHRLLLYNTHTAERIDIVYRRGDQYIPGALAQLNYFLRDHRTGDVRQFDPRVYDILSELTSSIGRPGGEVDIICGYRTSSTNESLRAHTT